MAWSLIDTVQHVHTLLLLHLPSFLHVSVLSAVRHHHPHACTNPNVPYPSATDRRHDTTARRASTRLGTEPTVVKLPQPPPSHVVPPFSRPLSHPIPHPRSRSIPALYQPALYYHNPPSILPSILYYTIPYLIISPTHTSRPTCETANGHSS